MPVIAIALAIVLVAAALGVLLLEVCWRCDSELRTPKRSVLELAERRT